MIKPFIVISSVYQQSELDEIFQRVEDECLAKGMLPLNRGKVFLGLLRRSKVAKVLLDPDRLVAAISEAVGYKVKMTEHSEFQINTVGAWHTDLGSHRGGYLPQGMTITPDLETKICRVAIFSREAIQRGKHTQFNVNGSIVLPTLAYGDLLVFPPEQLHRATPPNKFARAAFAIATRVKPTALAKLFFALETCLRMRENRKAIFITCGALEGGVTDHYARRNLEREDEQLGWANL